MSIDLRHNFCHSKRVFVRYRLVVVSEKDVVDENYDDKLFVNEINTGSNALQKPSTFPSSTCIDLLQGDHVCYGGYSCSMCSSNIPYMLTAACCWMY